MTHIEQRGGTAAQWTADNPVLNKYEMGWESDTRKGKLGDGVSAWNSLPYIFGVSSVAGKTGIVSLAVADVAGAAPLADPVFTGNPKAPDRAAGNNSQSIANTAFVTAAVNAFAVTVAAIDAAKAPKDSPTFTGDPKAPTPATADNDTSIATTAFVKAQGYATLDSPTFTGDPKAPTPVVTDNDTSIATTKFVNDYVKAQDTGTRNITALADNAWKSAFPNSRLYIRRVGPVVYLNIVQKDNTTSTAVTVMSSSAAQAFPAGFRVPVTDVSGEVTSQAVGIAFNNSNGSLGGAQLLINKSNYYTDLVMYGLASGIKAHGQIVYTTNEAFPTSLPGSAL